ncbi:patatin-like phospholipase family protein [Streptococcus caprae]|uniref:Patatin family protein n=1 Tax=Streptococcus caprae TaxID=1640501 RepID=A0ABV8CSW0_9STRE
MTVGLALEGGGMRGLYTAGVLDAFMEADIRVDGIVGVSAGALFGVNYVSGQKGRALRYNKHFAKDPNYMGFRSWLTTGNMVNKDFTYYKVPFELDVFDEAAFEESSVDFYSVATNIETGKAEYHLITDVRQEMELLRASSALPLVSRVVEWQGKKYLDGGLSDSIPIDFAKSLGFDKLIVVLTRPLDYRKKASSPLPYKLAYRKYPKFVEVASKRYLHYNKAVEKIAEQEMQGELFAIRPSQNLVIGRLEKDSDKFDEIYGIGVADAEAALPELRAYLAREDN